MLLEVVRGFLWVLVIVKGDNQDGFLRWYSLAALLSVPSEVYVWPAEEFGSRGIAPDDSPSIS